MIQRKFASIQPIFQNGVVTLVAIAEDGTAWSCRGHIMDHWVPHSEGQQWVQIPPLPGKEQAVLPPIAL